MDNQSFDLSKTIKELKEILQKRKLLQTEYENEQQVKINQLMQKLSSLTKISKDTETFTNPTESFSLHRPNSLNSLNLSRNYKSPSESSSSSNNKQANLEQPYPKDSYREVATILEENAYLKENNLKLKEKLIRVGEESANLQGQYQEVAKFVQKYQNHMKSMQSEVERSRNSRSGSLENNFSDFRNLKN